MPRPGHRWYHVTINTYGTWLPGDPRGFHSRGHRVHSSGDYREPPPEREHAGLHRWSKERSAASVSLPAQLQPVILRALVEKALQQDVRLLVASLDHHHAHLLAELPQDRGAARQRVGGWKRTASHTVRNNLPGRIWAKSCDLRPLATRHRQLEVHRYIQKHRLQWSFVWTPAAGLQPPADSPPAHPRR